VGTFFLNIYGSAIRVWSYHERDGRFFTAREIHDRPSSYRSELNEDRLIENLISNLIENLKRISAIPRQISTQLGARAQLDEFDRQLSPSIP
jgi:hypothetical protein